MKTKLNIWENPKLKVNPFITPTNYFEELPEQIQNKRLGVLKGKSFRNIKVYTYSILGLNNKLGVLAMVFCIGLCGWFYYLSQNKIVKPNLVLSDNSQATNIEQKQMVTAHVLENIEMFDEQILIDQLSVTDTLANNQVNQKKSDTLPIVNYQDLQNSNEQESIKNYLIENTQVHELVDGIL